MLVTLRPLAPIGYLPAFRKYHNRCLVAGWPVFFEFTGVEQINFCTSAGAHADLSLGRSS